MHGHSLRVIADVIPRYMIERGIQHPDLDEAFAAEDLRDRKQAMLDHSDVIVALPGGIGTYDEFFDLLAMKQLKRHDRPMFLFNINGYFEPPVIIDPINPFMIKSRIITGSNNVEKIAKSMTRNYTYSICCQELPVGAKVKKIRMVLGWSVIKKYRELSSIVWDVFRLPLARIRIIETEAGETLFSDISRLPLEELSEREIQHLAERIRWAK